jgi:hypothetical protein
MGNSPCRCVSNETSIYGKFPWISRDVCSLKNPKISKNNTTGGSSLIKSHLQAAGVLAKLAPSTTSTSETQSVRDAGQCC